MAEREVRYCTTEDGVRIAYCVTGEGPPLLWCPIFVESFSLVEKHPIYADLLGRLRKRWTLIQYDPRGVGLSTRDVTDFSGRAMVADIKAVVGASGFQKLSIWASVGTGPRAVAFSAANPKSVSHLVLYDTYHRADEAWPIEQNRGMAELCRSNWKLAAEVMANMGSRAEVRDSVLREYPEDPLMVMARVFEESTDGKVAAALYLESRESWDVTEMLPSLRLPVLVVHHLHNPIFPLEGAQTMAARIPGARLITIDEPGGSPVASGTREHLPAAIVDFLPQREQADQPGAVQGPFRTVLFTDLVGHTEMMSRLGDERGRAVLREHERITREVLKARGGTEVKTMGDGFMASFGSVTKAVECAIALQRVFAEREGEPLAVRVGLNAGEPIEEEGDLFGATVILASRIAAKAEGGEILVSDNVRSLSAGKGFLFADRGEFVAKGFEEPVRVYEVRWQDEH
jgi:class 3 adenylate cyclase/pimeloyl-ACP methyl ester carboxylesterase